MIYISPDISLKNAELLFTFIRSPGPGGQNVNKVSTAVQLRFNLLQSPSIPDELKLRIIKKLTSKLSTEGELIIKANRYRTQLKNKEDAIERLQELLIKAAHVPKKRKKTKPSKAQVQNRLAKKKIQGQKKKDRGKKSFD